MPSVAAYVGYALRPAGVSLAWRQLTARRLRFAAAVTGIAGWVARHGTPLRLDDAYSSPHFQPEIDQRTGYRTRSVLCVPWHDEQGRVFAVAQALNKMGAPAFSEWDLERFTSFLHPLGRLLRQVLATEATLAATTTR